MGEPAGQIFIEPPLVCIEILSHRDSLNDMQEVIADYVGIGVPYCCIINPWKRIVYTRSMNGFQKISDRVLRTASPHPELVIPADELFES